MADRFSLETENRNGIHVLRARGKLTLGEATSVLGDAVKKLVEGGAVQVLLDLAGVGYVDSAGLGALVSAYTSVTSRGGKFVLVGLQKRVADLLTLTKLFTVFQVFDTVEQAAAALNAPAAE